MNTQRSIVLVRMDRELKRKATEALTNMGLTASDAVRLLFHRIAVDQAFPLELKVPNARTRRAIRLLQRVPQGLEATLSFRPLRHDATEYGNVAAYRHRCPA